jgi:hypothetical protein
LGFAPARKAGCSFRGYIRAAALGSDYKPPVNPELRQILLMLYQELKRQGGNLNQIARQLNSYQLSFAQAQPSIDAVSKSLLATYQAIRTALSHGTAEPMA